MLDTLSDIDLRYQSKLYPFFIIEVLKFSILITYWHFDIYSVKLSVKNVKKKSIEAKSALLVFRKR